MANIGLYFFLIAAYSPELNLIEPEGHQLKNHEIAGRMFEDEYDESDGSHESNRVKESKESLCL